MKKIYRAPKQLSFIEKKIEFGGSLLVGKRNETRPISTKKSMHVVLKSENARGDLALINHKSAIEKAIAKVSAKFQVKVYDQSVNNNHLHLIVRTKSRCAYQAWIRTLAAEIVGTIARRTKRTLKNFFTQRPYTKILSWGRQMKRALDYVVYNQMEYFGLRPKAALAKSDLRSPSINLRRGRSD